MTLSIAEVSKPGKPMVVAQTHQVRMVISSDEAAAHSPFIVMVEDVIAPPSGFPTHPHRGMETVTFVLEGQLQHQDHTGASGVLDAGAVEFMTAGSGVMHSEMPGPHGVRSLQLWLNLPARLKWTPARYTDLALESTPVHREPGVEARVYAGRLGDLHVPHGTTWPLTLIELQLEAGSRFELPVPAGERVFAYMVSGNADMGIEGRAVASGEVAWPALSQPGVASTLRVVARDAVRLLVYASPVIDEPIAMGGPFVMNTAQEIKQAFEDLRAGRQTTAAPRP